MMKWVFAILLFLTACSSGRIDPLEQQPSEIVRPNTFIEDIEVGRVRGELIIQGSVTTSDSCGNFYQSMIVQDPTGVIELRFSFYDIYSMYRVGEVVCVDLFDRIVKEENGIKCVDMGSMTMAAKTVFRQGLYDMILPVEVKISEIDSTKIGRLVRMSGGEFNNGGKNDWSGEQKYTIGKESATVYTTPFASFANETLPLGKVSLMGIVTIYNGKFQLKLRSPEDCTPNSSLD